MKAYADIADFDEDRRIDIIGKTVTVGRQTVAFVTDAAAGLRAVHPACAA